MGQSLSVVIITLNEEANIGRTLAAVAELVKQTNGEIIVVDSGSADRTVDIAKSYGAKVFVEPWKGYAAQKNSAIDKASCDWILSLDADEEVTRDLGHVIEMTLGPHKIENISGYEIDRKNFFLGKWVRHGGFFPDRKLRLFRRGSGHFKDLAVHETVALSGEKAVLFYCWDVCDYDLALIHHAYPTLQSYIGHMNKYSSLGAEMAVAEKPRGFSLWNIIVRPWATFIYNYFLRLGFLDGKEGLLLHMYHAVYVSWKYAKAWELSCKKRESPEKSDSALA